jgi:hypothetical protein
MAISKAYVASVIGACISAAGCADEVATAEKIACDRGSSRTHPGNTGMDIAAKMRCTSCDR